MAYIKKFPAQQGHQIVDELGRNERTPIASAAQHSERAFEAGQIAPGADVGAPAHQGVDHLQATGKLPAVQILLGHTKIESTVRYLGADVQYTLSLSERTEI